MDERTELALWTVGSLLLSALVANISWIALQYPHSRTARLTRRLSSLPFSHALVFLARFIYYIALPYIVLLTRLLSPVVIGVQGTHSSDLPWWLMGWSLEDWAAAWGWAAGLGSIALAMLVVGWWNVYHSLRDQALPQKGWAACSILVTAREGLYTQIHWAFYRATPLVFISDLYWATLAGAALVWFEWVLNPGWHANIADGPHREQTLMQMGWLVLSTAVFAMTRNIWPALTLHIVLDWGVGRWVRLLGSRRAATQQTLAQ